MHPLQMKFGRTTIMVMVGAVWSVSFAMAFPVTYYSEVIVVPGETRVYNICMTQWPDGKQHFSQIDYM